MSELLRGSPLFICGHYNSNHAYSGNPVITFFFPASVLRFAAGGH